MKFSKILQNARGMSLVSVMVAAGMIGGLSLVVMNLVQISKKTSKTMEADLEVNQMHQMVLRHLRNSENCTATFVGKNFGDLLEVSSTDAVIKKLDSTGAVVDYRLVTEEHPVQLKSIRLYVPSTSTSIPSNAHMSYSGNELGKDGWDVIVQFTYSKYQSSGTGAAKIFGATEVVKFERIILNNFSVPTMVDDPADCAGATQVLTHGREFDFEEDSEAMFFGQCHDAAVTNAIVGCFDR